MMDGHRFPPQHANNAFPATGEALNLDKLSARPTDVLPGQRFDFFGGAIVLHSRAPFEIWFRSETLDIITFSLDCIGRVFMTRGQEPVQDVSLLPGRMHFFPAGEPLFMRYDGSDMQLVSVLVRSDRVRSIASSLDTAMENWAGQAVDNLQSPVADGLARRLRDFMLGGSPGGAVVAESMATMALYEALSALPGSSMQAYAPRSEIDRTPMRRALDYIEENLGANITLNDIAAVACKSPFHFARRFKETMGITPVAYLIDRRIERSKELLRRTDLAIATIAEQCGFNSQSHYCRTFRRLTETTPRDYRRG